MPIPKPKAGEDRKIFIGRCMDDPVMLKEYPETTVRAGVCNTAFDRAKLQDGEVLPDYLKGILPEDKDKLKLETKRLENVEILRTGKWNGREFTTKTLDQGVANFDAGLIEPYLNIAHDDKLTKDMQKILGVFSFGSVEKLWRKGEKLLANFKQVPKIVAEWIESGALKQKSVEWWHTFKKGNGEETQNVLEAVSFFGANGIPAVSGLSDVVGLYQSVLSKKTFDNSEDGEKGVILLKEESSMAEVKIDSAELEKLKASAKKTATLETELSTFQVKADEEKKAELAKVGKEKDEKIAKLEKDGKDRDAKDAEKHKETLKAEGKAFIDKIVLDKKLAPAYQADEIERYVELKLVIESADEAGKKTAEEKFARFKKKHEDSGEVANFTTLPDVETSGGGSVDRSLLQDENKLEEAIEGRVKAKHIDWNKAREEILAEIEMGGV